MYRSASPQSTDVLTAVGAQQPAPEASSQRLRMRPRPQLADWLEGPAPVQVFDVSLPVSGLPARFYKPRKFTTDVVIFLHGGDWGQGNADTCDSACRRFSRVSGLAVLSLDCGRSTSSLAPSGVDAAMSALRFLRSAVAAELVGEAPEAVGLVGDSGGGLIATQAAMGLRAEPHILPDAMMLLYPSSEVPSLSKPPHTPILASRSEAPQDLAGMPPTLLISCENDPQRAQGEALIADLKRCGVPTYRRCERGKVHRFLQWHRSSGACADAGTRAALDFADVLRRHARRSSAPA